MTNSKRWGRLVAGTLMLLFLGLIYGWSIFKAPFNAIFPSWSIGQISLTFTISMVFFCLAGFVAGQIVKKIGPKMVVWISAILLVIGFVGVSFLNVENPSTSLKMLYVMYGVFCGSGVGMAYNVIVSVVNSWFADKSGLASGIIMMGFGLGGIVLGGGAITIVGQIGVLETFKILGIGIGIVLFIGGFFMKLPEPGEAPTKAIANGDTAMEDVPPKEVLKNVGFWIFMVWAVLLNSAGLLVFSSAASIAVAFGAPATVGLIVSLCNGCGRVIMGALFDKIGRKPTLIIDSLILILSGGFLFLGATTSSMVFIIIGLVLVGVAYSGGPTLTASFLLATFGPKYFPMNLSLGIFSLIPAAIAGPMISAKLLTASGGDYTSTFILIIGLGIGAMVASLIVNKISK
ncbi:MAG: MFS transporter [Anaerovoracaceae bacterium]